MRELSQRRRTFVVSVVPLAGWIPVAGLSIIGTQAAKSLADARTAILVVAAITLLLLGPAVYGLYRFGNRESYCITDWVIVVLVSALLLTPAGLIVYIAFRALFWVT